MRRFTAMFCGLVGLSCLAGWTGCSVTSANEGSSSTAKATNVAGKDSEVALPQGFARFADTCSTSIGEGNVTYFSLTVDYPKDNERVRQWLHWLAKNSLSTDIDGAFASDLYHGYDDAYLKGGVSGATSDFSELNALLFKQFVDEMKTEYDEAVPSGLGYSTDIEVCDANDRYQTYHVYIFGYFGGAHGMYTENYISYDVRDNQPINNAYLFLPGSTDGIWHEVLTEIGKDKKWYEWYGDKEMPADSVAVHLDQWGDVSSAAQLPEAGIVNDSIVFTFQPYEIACYAAGTFNIKLPHTALQPYLTPRALPLFD